MAAKTVPPRIARSVDEIGADIAYELEALADALLLECPPGFSARDEEEYALRLSLRSKGARIKVLSLAVLTLFSDGDDSDAASISHNVYGTDIAVAGASA